LLATILSVLGIVTFYVILNWDDILDIVGAVASFIKDIQGQIWAFLAIVSFAFTFYGKFKQTALPKKLTQILEMDRLAKALEFFDSLLDRFSYEDLLGLLLNVDTISAEMKVAIQEIAAIYNGKKLPKPVPPTPARGPSASEKEKRKALANRVAELLRKVGHKVEVSLEDDTLLRQVPSPADLRALFFRRYGKQLEEAELRKQTRLRKLQEDLRRQQERLAALLRELAPTQDEEKKEV